MDTAAAECERQADGQRKETEGEGERDRKRKRRRGEKNVGDMKICEGAREQESKAEPVKNAAVSFFSLRHCPDNTYEIGMS